MPGVKVKVIDRVSMQCPVPATQPEAAEFTRKLASYFVEGYVLAGASTISDGTQRDPYVVGFKLTLERK